MLLFISSLIWFSLMLSTPAGVRISTFFSNRFSKKEESPIKFSIDGSSKSTIKSISLLSTCSPLTKDPKSPISLTLYFNKISLCFLSKSSISCFAKSFFCFFISCLYRGDKSHKCCRETLSSRRSGCFFCNFLKVLKNVLLHIKVLISKARSLSHQQHLSLFYHACILPSPL